MFLYNCNWSEEWKQAKIWLFVTLQIEFGKFLHQTQRPLRWTLHWIEPLGKVQPWRITLREQQSMGAMTQSWRMGSVHLRISILIRGWLSTLVHQLTSTGPLWPMQTCSLVSMKAEYLTQNGFGWTITVSLIYNIRNVKTELLLSVTTEIICSRWVMSREKSAHEKDN